MGKKEENNRPRLTIVGIMCIVIGLVIGFEIKRVHIGLLIGLALGLLSGNLLKKRS
jgi:hypothetical protein